MYKHQRPYMTADKVWLCKVVYMHTLLRLSTKNGKNIPCTCVRVCTCMYVSVCTCMCMLCVCVCGCVCMSVYVCATAYATYTSQNYCTTSFKLPIPNVSPTCVNYL